MLQGLQAQKKYGNQLCLYINRKWFSVRLRFWVNAASVMSEWHSNTRLFLNTHFSLARYSTNYFHDKAPEKVQRHWEFVCVSKVSIRNRDKLQSQG